MDQGQAVQAAPTDAELERAIASVPGVVSAGIDRSGATGQSRMRLRLAPGEDEEAVAWSVAATLRERFGIALDPDAIRPRPTGAVAPTDDVRVVQGLDRDGATPDGATPGADAEVDRPPSGDPDPDVVGPRPRAANELADTRERLRLAAAHALDGVADLDGVVDLVDLDGVTDLIDLADLIEDDGSRAAGSGRADAVASEPEVDTGLRSRAVIPRSVIPRAAIRDLQVRRDERSVQVTVVLGHGDRVREGRASSVPTSHGTLRAVAEATVASLRGLTEEPLLVGIDRVSASHGEDSPVATVVLSLVTHRGEERLLGASIIHDCPERAVLRATLDALNRRVMPLLLDRDGER